MTMSNNLLRIHKQLEIDRNCFFDLTSDQRGILLKWALGLKTGEATFDNEELKLDGILYKNESRKCPFRFQFQREKALERLNDIWQNIYGIEHKKWTIDDQEIFSNLMPYDIDRLEQVLFVVGDKYRIKAGCEMAKIMKVRDVPGFAAVFEFTLRRLVDYDESAMRDFDTDTSKKNEIERELNNLIVETEEMFHPSDGKSLSFINKFAAANHFDKHPIVSEEGDHNLSPNEYMALARNMASGKSAGIENDIRFNQEGTALKCTFQNERHLIVRYDNILDHTSVIATLFPKRLKRQRNKATGKTNKVPRIRKNKQKEK